MIHDFTRPPAGPFRVTSMDGKTELRDVVWCDTVSGEYMEFVRDARGKFKLADDGETIESRRGIIKGGLIVSRIRIKGIKAHR